MFLPLNPSEGVNIFNRIHRWSSRWSGDLMADSSGLRLLLGFVIGFVFVIVVKLTLRMGVGCSRIRLACKSMRIASPHHRTAVLVYRAHAYEASMAGRFRTISRRLAIHCRIRANPFHLRIHANCESASHVVSI